MDKMKKVIIVHRWDGTPESDWYPWLKRELESKGFEVIVPEMPETSEPSIENWVDHLRIVVGSVDEETYFVGHSIGCQTIMRYLSSLSDVKIGGIVFVAGWFNLDNLEGEEVVAIAKPWIETPIDFAKVRNKTNKITVFLSDNEPYGFVDENASIFEDKLDAKVIIESEKGHFIEDDGITEVPEVLEELLRFSKT